MNRTHREHFNPLSDMPAKDRGSVHSQVQALSGPVTQRASDSGTSRISGRLLRDAAREAGLFQRSVLGHLDHKDWINRVRADGQHLIDLLSEMGFSPSVAR